MEDEKTKYPIIDAILENTVFSVLINLLTLYALFGDDIRVMTTRKNADIGFDIVTIIALIAFTFEIIFSVLARPGYNFSFFFWLDVISTVSLILDI